MPNSQARPADAVLTEIVEVSVGATILGLRQVNIVRRRLASEYPQLQPAIDLALDQVDASVGPASELLGGLVQLVGEAAPGAIGESITETGELIARLGPEAIRLCGLTARE